MYIDYKNSVCEHFSKKVRLGTIRLSKWHIDTKNFAKYLELSLVLLEIKSKSIQQMPGFSPKFSTNCSIHDFCTKFKSLNLQGFEPAVTLSQSCMAPPSLSQL